MKTDNNFTVEFRQLIEKVNCHATDSAEFIATLTVMRNELNDHIKVADQLERAIDTSEIEIMKNTPTTNLQFLQSELEGADVDGFKFSVEHYNGMRFTKDQQFIVMFETHDQYLLVQTTSDGGATLTPEFEVPICEGPSSDDVIAALTPVFKELVK